MKKRVFCAFLSFVLCISMSVPTWAVTAAELKKQKEEAEKELNSIQSSISNIEENKDAVAGELEELDTQLVDLLSTVEILEHDIKNKEIEIADATTAYEAAQADEASQYAAMKRRIKFMYEKGDMGYMQLLIESQSISDLVNKADYIEKLYEYDRTLLVRYQETKAEVLALKEELVSEKSEMVELEADLTAQQEELQVMIEEKQATVENFDAQLSSAKKQANAYSSAIKTQTSQIKKLEAEEAAKKKAAEDAAKKKAAEEAAAKQKAGQTGQTSTSSSGSSDSSGEPSGGSSGSSSGGSSAGSGRGQEIANYACQFVGNPYVPGGTSLTNGADCSGFTWAVYQNFGISLPRSSYAQASGGSEVSYSDMQPGDIIYYGGHVGIYVGNGTIVHASTQATGIKYSSATYRSIITIRRYY